MSFAITIDCVATGPGFEQALRGQLAGEHAKRRQAEEDAQRRIIFEALAAAGKAAPTLLNDHQNASRAARIAADEHAELARDAAAYETLAKHPDATIAKAGAEAFVKTEAERQKAERVRDDRQREADCAQALAEASVPASKLAHVAVTYDALIESGVKAAIVLASGLEALGVKAVKLQIAGHVESLPEDAAQVSAHVWPLR